MTRQSTPTGLGRRPAASPIGSAPATRTKTLALVMNRVDSGKWHHMVLEMGRTRPAVHLGFELSMVATV